MDCFYFCSFFFFQERNNLVFSSENSAGTRVNLPPSPRSAAPCLLWQGTSSQVLCFPCLFLSPASVSLWRTYRKLWLQVHRLLICKDVSFSKEQALLCYLLFSTDVVMVSRAGLAFSPQCSRDILDERTSSSRRWYPRTACIFLCLCSAHWVFSTRTCRQELCGHSHFYCL